MKTRRKIKLGTRGSNLALRQATAAADALRAAFPGISVQTIIVTTHGDTVSGHQPSGVEARGMFTKELEHKLAAGALDIAVHSLKDLPTVLHQDLCLAAVLKREHPFDALVSDQNIRLCDLPRGARIGTASIRRAAQIRSFRSDLTVVPVRGNIETRLRKMREQSYDALVLAHAGLIRLGLEHMAVDIIPPHIMLPAAGQGAIAVEARTRDAEVCKMCTAINDLKTARETQAERAFLRRLGAGCRMPAGCFAAADGDMITIQGCIAAHDGARTVSATMRGTFDDPEALGSALAEKLLAQGGAELLADIQQGENAHD